MDVKIFERRVNIDSEWKAIEPVLQKLNRGDLLKYREITEHTGVQYNANKWTKLITKIRKYITTEFGACICENRVGYRVPTNYGTVECAVKRQEKIDRENNRVGFALSRVDVEDLTEEQKEVAVLVVQQATQMKQASREQKGERKALFAKSETLPRIRGY